MRTKAAVLYGINEPLVIEEVEIDDPKDREVLVRMTATGVCRSDLSAARGFARPHLPVILGHEAAAEVVKCGPGVTRVKPGDRVVLSWAPNCGHCFYCLEARPTLCDTYTEAAGIGALWDGTGRIRTPGGEKIHHFSQVSSFAEHMVVPENGCVPIHPEIPATIAALVGCAVTTGYGAAVNDANVRAGSSVAIWGVGGVGLNALMGAKVRGPAIIIGVDVNPEKEAVAKRFGATHFVNPREVEDVPAAIRELTEGRGADYTIECSGRPEAIEQAYHSARRGGTVVPVGEARKEETVTLPARLLPDEQKRIVGSYYGGGVPERDFHQILGLYRRGLLDLDALVGETMPLELINDGFRMLDEGVETRSVVVFD
jgi:Zn-dependent alcohol dehydrogenase